MSSDQSLCIACIGLIELPKQHGPLFGLGLLLTVGKGLCFLLRLLCLALLLSITSLSQFAGGFIEPATML